MRGRFHIKTTQIPPFFCCIPVFLSIAFSKFISKNQVKVMRINRNIKIWGAVVYFLLTAQIFYNS